jgi:cytochrome c oxidase subunit 2
VIVAALVAAPSMLDPNGPEARHLAGVWWLMFALSSAVYAIVAGLVITAIVRRRRAEPDPDLPPPRWTGRLREEAFIWIGGIAIPIVILTVIAVVTVTTTTNLRQREPGALKLEVVGRRWFWDVSYPGTAVRTANEIHVPVGRPIEARLLSDDVIHSFWVPQLFGKLDMVPGQPNTLHFEASKPGTYRGLCAEFCGIQHARMDFLVVAESPAAFDRWVTRNESLATASPVSEAGATGERVFQRESCGGCHTIRGTTGHGTIGPDLTDFGTRKWIGAITVPNDRGRLAAWISNSQSIKPGNLMPPISLEPDDLDALVTYLEGRK